MIRDVMERRIRARAYAPGANIPNEADLADEFGCARATVNRALRDLAAAGFVERRRKAGTRVLESPRRRATLEIPLIRDEVEAAGQRYGYRLLSRRVGPAGAALAARLGLPEAAAVMALDSLHLADGAALMFETRQVVLATVPAIAGADLEHLSPNEWLLRQAPYTHGTMEFFSAAAGPAAAHLGGAETAPVLVMERVTWLHAAPITLAVQYFAPRYRLRLAL